MNRRKGRQHGHKADDCCPKCRRPYLDIPRSTHPLTRSIHHVFPKRHFRGKGPKICLHRMCHDELEKMIPRERQAIGFYRRVLYDFLRVGSVPYSKRRRRGRANVNVGLMGDRRHRQVA